MQEEQEGFKPEEKPPNSRPRVQTLLTVVIVIAALAAAYFVVLASAPARLTASQNACRQKA